MNPASGRDITIAFTEQNSTTAADAEFDITTSSPITIMAGDTSASIAGTISGAGITGEKKIDLQLTATNAEFADKDDRKKILKIFLSLSLHYQ